MKRFLDPYGSLGQVVNRVNDVAFLYLVEAIVVGWALLAQDFFVMFAAITFSGATAIWEAVLYSKLKIPLRDPFVGRQLSWRSLCTGLLTFAACQFVVWVTHVTDIGTPQNHEMVTRFGPYLPLLVVVVLTAYATALAWFFVHKWRKASKIVFERPPTDPVLEQMARELDDWLTGPKKAIQ